MRIGINALATQSGGGFTYLLHMLLHLASAPGGHHFIVIGTPRLIQKIMPVSARSSVEFVSVPISGLLHRLWWEQTVLPRLLRGMNVDVLLAPGNVGPLIQSVRFVLTVQNVDPLATIMRQVPWTFSLRMAALRALTVASARRAQRVIAVSEYARRLLVARGGDGLPVEVIPLGRPDDGDDPPPAESPAIRRRLGLSRPYLLAVSAVKYNKNYTRLVESFATAAIPDTDLVIAGAVEHQWAYHALIREIRQQRLGDRVRFIGAVDAITLRALFDGATSLVFPSLLESFGLPALEAMAYGVPVAASRIAVIEEVCGDAALYFNPDDVGNMADVLNQLLTNNSLRKRLSIAGKERSRQFSWTDTARRTLEMLVQAAAE